MYRSHVRYARICFDSRRKTSLDASCNLSPVGSECSLPFTGRHPDSSSRHGRFKEHQSHHPSSSPVGCCPWRYQRPRPIRSPKPCRKPSFGLWRGLPAPIYSVPGFTFVPEVKHMESYLERWISHDSKSWHGLRVAFSAHCCDMHRAAPDGRRP
jgi:hypothetical protein